MRLLHAYPYNREPHSETTVKKEKPFAMQHLAPLLQKSLLVSTSLKGCLGVLACSVLVTFLLVALAPASWAGDAPALVKPLLAPLLTPVTVSPPVTLAPNMAKVDVVNPNPLSNPRGLTYPGYRASNQLLMYNTGYGYPSTGTNEFGYEVTVVKNRVVDAEGADSAIPAEGYVLSGHGKQRNWLIKNAPLGATLNWDAKTQTLTSTVDYSSYRFMVEQALARLKALNLANNNLELQQTLNKANIDLLKADDLNAKGATAEAQASLISLNNQLEQTQWQHLPTFPQQAIKGVWHRPTESTSQEIAATLDKFKAAGLNSVFLETFFHGYPVFPSKTYTRYGITPNEYPKFAGRNILQLWLTEAHQRGMQVHAWAQVFYVGNKALGGAGGGVGPVLNKYPQWANWQRSAAVTGQLQPSTLESGHYFVDPANPEVRAFLLSVLDELMNDYAIDGLQLDYIRYPASFPKDRFSYVATTWGYSNYARQAFAQQFGADPLTLDPKKTPDLWQQWNSFKTEQINTFVSTVASHAQQAKQSKTSPNPSLLLSAAVFPGTEGLLTKHQNWPYWKQQGWVEALAPMNLTGSVRAVSKAVQFMQTQGSSTVKVEAGLFSPFNNLPAQRLIEQLQAALKAGANGYILFDSAHLNAAHQQALGLWQQQKALTVSPSTVPAATIKPESVERETKEEARQKAKKLRHKNKAPKKVKL
jgi:uncharacterized lipoprotein YddW (UPF0748 family)